MTGTPGDLTRIRMLDKTTIAQIAAGEVVERPASVVKELVENAIDAGAARIEVEITSRGGMIHSIRVSDNGTGMGSDDAEMAFLRHATSKIQAIGDLSSCCTLGFRGEAIASIAAISRTTLTTRLRGDALTGLRIVNEGGATITREECGAPEGTTLEVENLFYNTPARKKFQRTLHSEMAYINGMMERVILSHPGIAFRVLHNRREIMSSPPGALGSAILHLFGTEVARALIPVKFDGRLVRVTGEISRPSLSRQNHYQVFLSVNGRPVQSRGLAQAVREGYGTLLPSNRFPVAFLDLAIDPSRVDVNVHPTKREVRINHEAEVKDEISRAIRIALEGQDLLPSAENAEFPGIQTTLSGTQEPGYPSPDRAPGGVREPSTVLYPDTDRRLRQTEFSEPAGAEENSRVPEMEILGQLDETYILACPRGGGDLILIDQHAAHERILYEQTILAGNRDRVSQELLAPVPLHLSPREAALLPSLIPALEKEGFVVEEFGGGTYAVHSVPVVLGRNVYPEGIREIVSALLVGEEKSEVDEQERVRRAIACRGAIKAGASCTPEQCLRLVNQLRRANNPYTCPHGRPTMVALTRKQLDGLFLRTRK
ncbi:MAG: DNA mismatch repair endonuclease MutL [Methanolinea sp.]|nr:DNA mismatch repair endonuclease MutL [Methanolinea sp.]